MTASPVSLGPDETETVLRAAVRAVYGAGARLEGWTADRFATHGRHRVVRYDLRVREAGAPEAERHQWVGKFYDRGEDARRTGTILRALAGTESLAGGGVVSPRVVACDPQRGLLLMTYEAGHPLKAAIAQHGGVVLSAVGRALAALHAADIAIDHTTSPAAVLAELRPKVADLCAGFPDRAAALRRTLVALEDGMPPARAPAAFLHGDCGPAQLLWRMEEDHIVFLDFDQCTRGDPALDLGNLLTQLRRVSLREPGKLPLAYPSLRAAILDAYRRWSLPDPGLGRRVTWYEWVGRLRKIHGLTFDRTRHPEADAIERRQAEAIRLLSCERDPA